jgi:hypothetical protein
MASPHRRKTVKDTERRRLEMFIRVREFGQSNPAQFTPTSFAGEQLALVNTAIEGLEAQGGAQASGISASKEGSMSKAAARDELFEDLQANNRTARAMARTIPGVNDKFRVPHNQSDQGVLAAARAQAADALPLKAEFIKRGMPANFLEDLHADIAQFEEAISQQAQGRETHVEATAAIDQFIEQGINALRELDPIVRNIFANVPAKLAAWQSASHVERSPQRAKPTATPAQ